MEKRILLPLVFLAMKIKKNIQFIYQKNVVKKHLDLLLIGEEGKKHFVLSKDFYAWSYSVWKKEQKKYQNVIIKTASKLMANQEL